MIDILKKQFPHVDFTKEEPLKHKSFQEMSTMEVVIFTNEGLKLVWIGMPIVLFVADLIGTFLLYLWLNTLYVGIMLLIGIWIYYRIMKFYFKFAAGNPKQTFHNLFLYNPGGEK